MKSYQHHDEVADQGKAVPKPKQPNSSTGNRMMVRFIRPHSGPLYTTKPHIRLDGSTVNIRVDCCRLGHLFKLSDLDVPSIPSPTENQN